MITMYYIYYIIIHVYRRTGGYTYILVYTRAQGHLILA